MPWEDRLPVQVRKGTSIERVLPVGDDLAGLKNRIKSLSLRIRLSKMQPNDVVKIRINGNPTEMSAEGHRILSAELDPSVMKKGPNNLVVTYQSGNADSLQITSAELAIHYKNPK